MSSHQQPANWPHSHCVPSHVLKLQLRFAEIILPQSQLYSDVGLVQGDPGGITSRSFDVSIASDSVYHLSCWIDCPFHTASRDRLSTMRSFILGLKQTVRCGGLESRCVKCVKLRVIWFRDRCSDQLCASSRRLTFRSG